MSVIYRWWWDSPIRNDKIVFVPIQKMQYALAIGNNRLIIGTDILELQP